MSSACMPELSSNFGSHVKYCTHEQRCSTNMAPMRQALLPHQPKYFHFRKCVLSFAAEAIYCLIKSLSRATLHCARNERPTAMRTKRFQFSSENEKQHKKRNWFSFSLITQLNSSLPLLAAPFHSILLVKYLKCWNDWRQRCPSIDNRRSELGQCGPDNRLHHIIHIRIW